MNNRRRSNQRRRGKRRNTQQVGGNNLTVNRSSIPRTIGVNIRNKNSNLQTLKIKHRELIADLKAGPVNVFTTKKFEMNPGLGTAFPWLSQIARNFETYVWNSLKFTFVPNLGTNREGVVLMAPDYDAADDNLSLTKQELIAFQDSLRCPVWQFGSCPCSAQNLRKRKTCYVRKGQLKPNLDIKTYDVLQLIVGLLTDRDEGTFVGELWVDYTITLQTPQMDQLNIPDKDLGSYLYEPTTVSYPFLTNISDIVSTFLDSEVKFNGSTIDFFKPGGYLMELSGQLGEYLSGRVAPYLSLFGDVLNYVGINTTVDYDTTNPNPTFSESMYFEVPDREDSSASVKLEFDDLAALLYNVRVAISEASDVFGPFRTEKAKRQLALSRPPMKIGTKKELQMITFRQYRRELHSKRNGKEESEPVERGESVPVAKTTSKEGLDAPVLDKVTTPLWKITRT